MQNHYTPKGKHLTMDNRRLIERWKNENMSNRKIAGLLGKAPQTINNEVKRGTTLQQVRKGLYKKVYSADYAQTVYQTNRKRSVKKIILTKEMKEKGGEGPNAEPGGIARAGKHVHLHHILETIP